MSFVLQYPTVGRGAFPLSGLGGTLDLAGEGPGGYYRAPKTGSGLPLPGVVAARALRNGTICSVNDYGVNRAILAIQRKALLPIEDRDGIFGQMTAAAVKPMQSRLGLKDDGIVGPATMRKLAEQLIPSGLAPMIRKVTLGTLVLESNCDFGAVGESTTQDLGPAQINGPSHPSMSVDQRFDPDAAIPWMTTFIANNFIAMKNDEDASIAAYNLGIGGALAWIKAGRPQMFYTTDVWRYIARVKQGGTV